MPLMIPFLRGGLLSEGRDEKNYGVKMICFLYCFNKVPFMSI